MRNQCGRRFSQSNKEEQEQQHTHIISIFIQSIHWIEVISVDPFLEFWVTDTGGMKLRWR